MGDFNTNILNPRCDKSKKFVSFMENFSFSSLGTIPTHFHRTGSSQIDLMITNKRESVLRFNQVDVPCMSNHDLLFASLDVDVLLSSADPVSYRDYSRFNPSTAISIFNQISWDEFYQSNNPEILLHFFNEHVKTMFDTTIPVKTNVINRKCNPWFNAEVSRAIVDRDLAFRQWKTTRNDSDFEHFKRLRNYATSSILNAKQRYWNSKIAGSGSVKNMWKNLKSLNITRKNDGFLMNCSPDDINKHFSQSFSSPTRSFYTQNINSSETFFRFNEIQDYHIINAIYEVKSNAVGLDDIPIK